MACVRFEALRKIYSPTYGDTPLEVIHELDLYIQDGEFLVLVGPSGCGKSTLLRLIAGLERPSSGEILIDEIPVNKIRPSRRNVAMVFQNYALYPHLNVRHNLSFGLRRSYSRDFAQLIQDQLSLRTRRLPYPLKIPSKREEIIENRIKRVAKILELTELLDRLPRELSGGQKQRVALGRAIARKPAVFLMDEPLSNLDTKLRNETRKQIVELQRKLGTTTIYVTHDQVEAMTMGNRIAVLNEGRLQQLGTPMQIYAEPSNLFVAQFIGSPPISLIPITIGPGSTLIFGERRFPVEGPKAKAIQALEGKNFTVGLRPENWQLSPASNRSIPAEISHFEVLGNEQLITCRLLNGNHLISVRTNPNQFFVAGEIVHLNPDPTRWHIFDEQGQAINVPSQFQRKP